MPTADPALLTPVQIVEIALAASRSDGCVVVVTTESTANVRWANNTVTTSGVSDNLSWFVISVVGGASGTVNASASGAASARTVVEVVRQSEREAAAAASAGRAQDYAELVGPEQAGGSDEDFDTPGEQTTFGVYRRLLADLAPSFDEARSADRLLFGFARHEISTSYLGTSTGIRRRWVQPTGTVEVNAKSADLARSSWAGAYTADFTDVDVRAVTDGLTRRLDWAKSTVDLPPGRYDTVLPPTAVADFLLYLAWMAGARGAYEGRSAFSAPGGGTRLGERLSEQPLYLYSDPAYRGLDAAPFVLTGSSSDSFSVFDNGARIERTDIIADGRIANLVNTRSLAAEKGVPFRTVGDNLILDGGDDSLGVDDLVRGVDRGLLVTSQWYLREVDPMTMLLTGLTRDGVFLIEKGEVTGAVNNFRFNMSPLDVLRQAAVVGRTQAALSREWSDWFTRSAMPPVRVEGFNMSSVSKAQ
ncbi:Predicted Zn-dependent protease or its inactivated homolog [Nakamurella panacisegetis]|uniref:Predicted Zn-dependent protease or its inactivated homolog n=1 Tax=Nakamurella panacisegetis TaxID=1090615 RepID=A0A1H0MDJ6_9ACTN|nr:metallopeptidase TldD-related protein [Nakamurella panacisegetis]SDO78260.1 Predicted Zn-dependent protease or its inactivated homolog [Nakamurella panacisegetis]